MRKMGLMNRALMSVLYALAFWLALNLVFLLKVTSGEDDYRMPVVRKGTCFVTDEGSGLAAHCRRFVPLLTGSKKCLYRGSGRWFALCNRPRPERGQA